MALSPPITRGQASFACGLDPFHADHATDAGCRGAVGSVSDVIPAAYIYILRYSGERTRLLVQTFTVAKITNLPPENIICSTLALS